MWEVLSIQPSPKSVGCVNSFPMNLCTVWFLENTSLQFYLLSLKLITAKLTFVCVLVLCL